MKEFFIFCTMCSLAGHFLAIKPPIIQQPTFQSTNFENIFTWKIEEGSPPGTVYQVQYKIYGAPWNTKEECQNTTQLFCNLTREMEDVTERYYARVRAIVPNCCIFNWVQSLRFCPKDDTTIGKPSVNYIPGLQSIKFSIQPPDTPLRDKENRILTVADIFNKHIIDVQYEITLFFQKTDQKVWQNIENDTEFEITDLHPGTEYNGTVQLLYLFKKGDSQTFEVQTLADTRWLPYFFGMFLFILIFLFGTIYYLIYKYIKHHADQKPASLDFKDVFRFRPLLLNVELSPSSLSIDTPHVPEVRPAELCQPVLNILKHQESFSPTEVAYQQPNKTSPIQPPLQHFRQADAAPSTDYPPQVIKNSSLCPLEHNPSTLTYGVCMEETGSINEANYPIKIDSFTSSGPYKAQKPACANEELQESETHQKPKEEVKSVSQTQPLTFPEDSIGLPQEFPSLLRELVPPTIDGKTESFKKQAELLSSSSNIDQNAILAGGDSLLKPCPSKNLSQDLNLGQQSSWNLLACTDNGLPSKPPKLQIIDCSAQECQELKNEALTLNLAANTLDSPQIHRPFSSLFRNLELKLQWDSRPEENKAAF